MNRRKIVTGLLACVAVGLSGQAAWADALTDGIIRQLRKQGFSQIEVSRTFLGRTKIEAVSGGRRREIILNPKTGEILRDLLTADDGGSDQIVDRSDATGSRTVEQSSKDSSDDDRSDNSGKGSNNSGSGKSDDNSSDDDSGDDDSDDDSGDDK